MKNLILVLLALLTVSGHANAQPFSVGDVTLPKGGKVTMPISLIDTQNQYMGFQFVLSLPIGITVENNSLKKVGDFSATDHSLSVSLKNSDDNGNQYQIVSLSFSASAVPVGELMTLNLVADESVSVGEELTATINEIELSTLSAQPVTFSTQTFTVTIGEAIDPRITLDETSTSVPAATTEGVNIRVKRTIKAGEWSTLVLPFAMTESQVGEVFGEDVELAEFISYDVDDELTMINVTFESADLTDGLLANYPYLIKISKDVSEFLVTAKIEPDEENAVAEYAEGRGARRHVYGTFVGTLHAETSVPHGCLFLSGSKFWYSTGLTQMKAFRAYFEFEDVLTSFDEGYAQAKVNINLNDKTGIATLKAMTQGNNDVYTLQGILIGQGIDLKTLPRGVYIHKGEKLIIK